MLNKVRLKETKQSTRLAYCRGKNGAIGALCMWQKIVNGYMNCENEKVLGSKYI